MAKKKIEEPGDEFIAEPTLDSTPTEPVSEQAPTDEGAPYAWIEIGKTLIDLTDPPLKPFSLHIAGQSFTHVSEDIAGRWVYRLDK